jgi:hypothetical protein
LYNSNEKIIKTGIARLSVMMHSEYIDPRDAAKRFRSETDA